MSGYFNGAAHVLVVRPAAISHKTFLDTPTLALRRRNLTMEEDIFIARKKEKKVRAKDSLGKIT